MLLDFRIFRFETLWICSGHTHSHIHIVLLLARFLTGFVFLTMILQQYYSVNFEFRMECLLKTDIEENFYL